MSDRHLSSVEACLCCREVGERKKEDIQDYDVKGKERKTGLQTFSFFPMSTACLLFLIIAVFIEMPSSTKKHLFPSPGYYIYLLYKRFRVLLVSNSQQNSKYHNCD